MLGILGWQMATAETVRIREKESRVFAVSLVAAFCVEAGLVAAVALWPHSRPHFVKPSSIAVHMVTLPRPLAPQPKPQPKPVVQPPLVHKLPPKPLVTHAPTPYKVPAAPLKPKVVPKTVPVPRPEKPVPVVKAVPVAKPQKVVPAPAPSPSPQLLASLMSRYVGLVRPMIQEHLRVPTMLKAMGLSGHATIEFRLSPEGVVLWARVLMPSRIRAVNSAALRAVKRSAYPPFLKRMPKRDTTFEIAVHISGNG